MFKAVISGRLTRDASPKIITGSDKMGAYVTVASPYFTKNGEKTQFINMFLTGSEKFLKCLTKGKAIVCDCDVVITDLPAERPEGRGQDVKISVTKVQLL